MLQLRRVRCRSLLGDERTVETMSSSVQARRRKRVVLVVVEQSRLGAACLAEAYEQVVPLVQRSRRTQAQNGASVPVQAQRGRAGGQR